MDKVEIKKMSLNEVEEVFLIERVFFDVKSNESILSSFNSENLNYFVCYLNDTIIGFLECSIILDEAELYEIAIIENYQGKGYSKILMEYFIDYCKSMNVRTIFLEVNTINNKAISLYSKFDFRQYAIRKNYYGENDAILMKRDL